MDKNKIFIIFIIFLSLTLLTILSENRYKKNKESDSIRTSQSFQNTLSFTIKEHSMLPTLNIGEIVKVDLDYYKTRKPKKDDLIVFKFKTRKKPFVKRVIALEGEKIEIKNGIVYVNEKKIKEDYAIKDNSNFGPKIVSSNSVFVLGDNRKNSFDSRNFDFLPLSRIIGIVIEIKK